MSNTYHYMTLMSMPRPVVAQQRRFLENGGIREAMSAARREHREKQEADWCNQNNRNNQSNSNSSNSSNNSNAPLCPKCGKPMLKRMQKKGREQGREFWGCSDYPNCNGLLPINQNIQEK